MSPLQMLEANVTILQWCSMVSILLIAVLGGYLPYIFISSRKFPTIISYLNCASGGVLLGVALLHIFPETGEAMNARVGGFPMSYVVTFVGMMLMVTMIEIGHNHSHGTELEQVVAIENDDGCCEPGCECDGE